MIQLVILKVLKNCMFSFNIQFNSIIANFFLLFNHIFIGI